MDAAKEERGEMEEGRKGGQRGKVGRGGKC